MNSNPYSLSNCFLGLHLGRLKTPDLTSRDHQKRRCGQSCKIWSRESCFYLWFLLFIETPCLSVHPERLDLRDHQTLLQCPLRPRGQAVRRRPGIQGTQLPSQPITRPTTNQPVWHCRPWRSCNIWVDQIRSDNNLPTCRSLEACCQSWLPRSDVTGYGPFRLSENKKLRYCCDSRSYCMQKYDRLKQLLRDTLSILTPRLTYIVYSL